MNIILPVIPEFIPKYIYILVDKEKVKIYYNEYRFRTLYSIVRKVAEERDFIDGGTIYKIDAAIDKQIAEVITKISRATKFSEIVPLWFRYNLIHLSTIADRRNVIYDCRVNLASFFNLSLNVFINEVIQQFYIGVEAFRASRLNLPFSSLINSKEYAKYTNDEELKKTYLLNAFQLYLWRSPTAIDDIPDFDLPDRCYHYKELDINIIKELSKTRRPDLFSTFCLTVPEIFARNL